MIMADSNVENTKSQMRKGVLEYCILSLLHRGDSYASFTLFFALLFDLAHDWRDIFPLLFRLLPFCSIRGCLLFFEGDKVTNFS
jgi:hypothetical protein